VLSGLKVSLAERQVVSVIDTCLVVQRN